MDSDFNSLADSYLRHHATRSDNDFWAWQRVDEIVRAGDVDRAWEITLLLVRKAPDDDALGYIAAVLRAKSGRDFRPLHMREGRVPAEQETLGRPTLPIWPFYD